MGSIFIYYHFHTSNQRKASAYISHIALTQKVNEICTLVAGVSDMVRRRQGRRQL